MSLPAEVLPVALELARLGIDAAAGHFKSVGDVARAVVDSATKLVPREELIAYLTEGGQIRAEIAADIAESHKFDPPLKDPLDEDDP